jgi:hypothetical protein
MLPGTCTGPIISPEGTFTNAPRTVTTFPQFYGPIALTVDGAGTLYYVSSGGVDLNYINGVAAGATTPTLNISYTATGQIQGSNVAVDRAGNLYIPAAVSGPATIAGNTVTLSSVGLVTLRASEAADTDYTASSQQASFNMAQAQLTVTTNNATRYYGAANPVFIGSVTGARSTATRLLRASRQPQRPPRR